uniref:TctD-like protein n=1 Tax=Pterothamnion crispum TaxID=1550583 RepID=A0A4D6X0Y9_9FLOR|nr:hypothetical protein [Pterothamnion crispum]
MKKILIVDDDIYLRTSIATYLQSANFLVMSVESVHHALVYLNRNMPDLIITDIMMNQLDGYDFLDILKSSKNLSNIPVILLTAKGMTHDRIKGYDLGCNAYLTKPFNPQELISIINNIFSNINLIKNNIESNLQLDFRFLYDKSCISFTYREKTILSLVLKGFMNKEIAMQLNVSIRNVEKYVSRLLHKTKTRNRTELVNFILSLD